MRPFTMWHRRYAVVKSRRNLTPWLATLLMVCANATFAADCDLQLSSREVNYGSLHRGELATSVQMATVPLGKRQLTLTAVCRQPTAFAWRFEGVAASADAYRFARNGHFRVRLLQATVDGQSVQLSNASEPADGASGSVWMKPNNIVTTVSQGQRAVGKVFSAQVEIEAAIDDATSRVRDVSTLEGRGSFTLIER